MSNARLLEKRSEVIIVTLPQMAQHCPACMQTWSSWVESVPMPAKSLPIWGEFNGKLVKLGQLRTNFGQPLAELGTRSVEIGAKLAECGPILVDIGGVCPNLFARSTNFDRLRPQFDPTTRPNLRDLDQSRNSGLRSDKRRLPDIG